MSSTARRRRRTAALAALSTLAVGTLTAGPAQASADGVYSVPYSPTLYSHAHTARGAVTSPLTFTEWAGRGYPAPTPVATDFVRYSWSPEFYAVSYFDTWLWTKLTPAQWADAGYPQPRLAGHIEGTVYFQVPDRPEIYAVLNGRLHELTAEEWAAAGFPAPQASFQGAFKLSWTDEIAWFEIRDGSWTAKVLTLADWHRLGAPQPIVLPTLPGDFVCTVADGSGTLVYRGATFDDSLTYAQWQAAGYPQPECTIDRG